MSSVDVVSLLVDEDGSVNVNDAVAALDSGIARMHKEGVFITYEEAIGLVYAHLDYFHDVMTEQLLLLRRASDVQFALINQMRGDPNAKMPEPIDLDEQLQMSQAGAKLDRLARLYDILEGKREEDEKDWDEPHLPFDEGDADADPEEE